MRLAQERPINVVIMFGLRCDNVVNLRAPDVILSTPGDVVTTLSKNVRKNVRTTFMKRKYIEAKRSHNVYET